MTHLYVVNDGPFWKIGHSHKHIADEIRSGNSRIGSNN
jgi:hypothetical protein